MTSHQKKYGIILVFLVLIAVGTALFLYRWHFLWGLAGRKKPDEFALHVSRLPNRKFHPTMKNKPDNLLLLDSHPETIEPELKSGRWLVLYFSIYNSQDVLMERMTLRIIQQCAGKCRVAIRPTDGFEDLPKWLPESESRYSSIHPIWFALDDGKLVGETGFMLTEDELTDFVNKSFAGCED